MIRPPFMARVVAGMAVTAYEEACKLPSTAVTLPMTAVSQILQTSMRLQQTMTTLAIKGDQVFSLFDRAEEEPSWAVFDEDRSDGEVDVEAPEEPGPGRPATPGRFALYSMAPTDTTDAGAAPGPDRPDVDTDSPAAAHHVPVPEIAEELDYAALTLAQLRSRLRSLSVEDLTALLEYEERTAARAPFQTMLANRITSATAK